MAIPIGVLEKVGVGMSQSTVELTCEGNVQLWARLEGEDLEIEAPYIRALKVVA